MPLSIFIPQEYCNLCGREIPSSRRQSTFFGFVTSWSCPGPNCPNNEEAAEEALHPWGTPEQHEEPT